MREGLGKGKGRVRGGEGRKSLRVCGQNIHIFIHFKYISMMNSTEGGEAEGEQKKRTEKERRRGRTYLAIGVPTAPIMPPVTVMRVP